MKTPTIAKQIEVLVDEIACRRRSYTHGFGIHIGKIPSGKELNEIKCLHATVAVLELLKQISK